MTPSPFQKARWIWPESNNWDLHNSYALFRKGVKLDRLPAKAKLFITADQSYQLYVNGHYVTRGPARGFQSHWPYDEVNVRPFLKKGRNLLAIRAHHPGFSNFQYLTAGFSGLLVAGKWGKLEIHSDASWKSRRQIGINRAAVPTSLQLFCQEHIDLNVEDPEWMQPGFDDSAWSDHPVTHPWNGMPWPELEERGIPQLEEIPVNPIRVLGIAAGTSAKGYADVRDVARLRHSEGLAHDPAELSAQEIRVEPMRRGKFRSYLIDFGRTVIGSLDLEITGAVGGEIVDSLHVETIHAATLTPDYTPDMHCRMAFGHRLKCRPGNQRHAFYHGFGFRYFVLTVRDATAEITIKPSLRTAFYPLKANGAFQSSETELNQIWEICAWTQRVCSLDAYVDTPWREQAQWWGDARVQAKNTFFYDGDRRLFRRGIAQIAAQVTPEGLTYGHAPTMAHHCILPDFTLIWMLTLWDDYWQTGSTEVFSKHAEKMAKAFAYFESQMDARTGLLKSDPRFWLFLDWTEIHRDGFSAVYNLWLLIALERMAQLHRLTRNVRAARSLEEWATRLRQALGRLVRADGLLTEGLTPDGRPVTEISIHAQTLAILADFQPEHHVERFDRVLRPFLKGERIGKAVPSAYWLTYLFEVLGEAGDGGAVVDFIREKWRPMIEHGTTWEGFDRVLGDVSSSHAWSAHPLYHLMQVLGGIRQTAPGWSKISVSPTFAGDFAKVVVPTPLGKIRSEWQRRKGKITLTLSLPKGVTAQVQLPNQKAFAATGQQRFLIESEYKKAGSFTSRPCEFLSLDS